MKALEELKEMLEDELKKIAKKGDITPSELDSAYKVVDIIKDIGEITKHEHEMQEYSSTGGYSQRGGYSMMDGGHSQTYPMYSRYMPMGYDMMPYSREGGMSYDVGTSYDGRHGRDGDGDGHYSEGRHGEGEGSSYARRRRDSRGRYSSDGGSYEGRGGYSRHSEKERMIARLEEMLETVSSERTRQAIERCIDQLED